MSNKSTPLHFYSSHEEEMKKRKAFLLSIALMLAFSLPISAQDPAQPADAQQNQQEDPIRQLNLTPEQREKIRAITEDNRNERVMINRRLREAQAALEETLDSDSPSESAVEERIRDVATAQAAQIRMRALTELKIRSVLTPDQLKIWRGLRAQIRRQINNPDARQNRRNAPNQGNGMAPLFPRNRRGALPVQPRP